ncbi:MAG: choice-of-anchor Q domain-containing protein [Marinicella sp.]
MSKFIGCLLIFFSIQGKAQIDCSVTTSRSVAGATIIGDGSPGSITTAAIQNALDAGGTILLDQGPNPTVVNLTSTLTVSQEAVIDGGGLVTLNGQQQRRILLIQNPSNLVFTVTIQNLTMAEGFTPAASGAAVFLEPGGPWQAVSLEVVNSHFVDNHAIQVEQDGGGGAIYAIGFDQVLISHSIFENNSGSNGGAFYSLGSDNIRITDSIFDGNTATGNSGNPGNGGNAGAIGVDGAARTINICRSAIKNNMANAYGVGFFSVMYDQDSLTAFTDVLFENNHNDLDFGLAGGAYIQGGPFMIHRSSFIDNESRGAGGIFLGPNANGEIVNSTVFGNIATNTLGGGLSISDSAEVTLRHVTIANNHAPCGVCFAGGISLGVGNQTTMYNSILVDNTGGNVFNPWNILNPVAGSHNLQFPQTRPNGQAEVQATAMTTWADPEIATPDMNGGETPTMAIESGSPATNLALAGQSTPADQRGISRFLNADLGAFEYNLDLIFMDGFD